MSVLLQKAWKINSCFIKCVTLKKGFASGTKKIVTPSKHFNETNSLSLYISQKFPTVRLEAFQHIKMASSCGSKKVVLRQNYSPPLYKILHTTLNFKLDEETSEVTSHLFIKRLSKETKPLDLFLNGEELQLKSLHLTRHDNDLDRLLNTKTCFTITSDAKPLHDNQYRLVKENEDHDNGIIISGEILPTDPNVVFKISAQVLVHPSQNLQLSGLYISGSLLCTQCEPHGFRRITYFIDRPDNLSTFLVKLQAENQKYPVLLSNGNLIGKGSFEEESIEEIVQPDLTCEHLIKKKKISQMERHYVVYEDPFPKPSYLFALVAGDMACLKDTFKNGDKGNVHLTLWCENHEKSRLGWAMESLKCVMNWDREMYNLHYDLKYFNLVAAPNFNAGAMENKSLNIFNSALLLCSPETSTDAEFMTIMSVVGHEYFHNWTGNRVTCRDWFQLTLKEGLTVYREQEFYASRWSAAVSRIEDVHTLRCSQFPEDSGPLSHPVRPDSYLAIDNFYTATVYEKGAEVVRLYETILGTEGFKKGFALYLQRHDGQAVTCEDFRNAMIDANNRPDLHAMEDWYKTPGTPVVRLHNVKYNEKKKTFQFTLTQKSPSTPLLIPIRVGLIGRSSKLDTIPEKVLLLHSCEPQEFIFNDIIEDCVVSILRRFSAPIRIEYENLPNEDLTFQLAYDSDSFCQWEAGQLLASRIILDLTEKIASQEIPTTIPDSLVEAYRCLVTNRDIDFSFLALLLTLPDQSTLLDTMMPPCDPVAVAQARDFVQYTLGSRLSHEFQELYDHLTSTRPKDYKVILEHVGQRKLRNLCLAYLTSSNPFETGVKDKQKCNMALKHFQSATNMTDIMGAMVVLKNIESEERNEAFTAFYNRCQGNDALLLKWFSLQATSNIPTVIQLVQELQHHEHFKSTNANYIRALYGGFARNTHAFHSEDGKGYALYADAIISIDTFNNQLASRLASRFSQWKRLRPNLQSFMKEQLNRILKTPNVSKECYEICVKTLAA